MADGNIYDNERATLGETLMNWKTAFPFLWHSFATDSSICLCNEVTSGFGLTYHL